MSSRLRKSRPEGSSLVLVAALGLWAGHATHATPGASAPIVSVRALVLGIAQDGGVPHIGCTQELCATARRDPPRRQRVACLGLVDERAGKRFLVDATPDLASQIESLNEGRAVDRARPVDGIFLTHAHIGHYTGLMYLGREALGAAGVPVYATPRMARFLRDNAPWSQLVGLGNIVVREIEPGCEVVLTPNLSVTPLLVPHRDELSDTVAFRVKGPSRSILYIPDIDAWDRWEHAVANEVAAVSVALLDGTFLSAAEVPGRSRSEVPHPPIEETMSRLAAAELRGRTLFIHLNHTNTLLWDSAARTRLETRGFGVARDGQEIPL